MRQDRYGEPTEVLHLTDVPVPDPGPGEVLVRVEAASANAADWHITTGEPLVMRPAVLGLRAPRWRIPGRDVAGVVEAVAPDVTTVVPGDAVLGWHIRGGGFAEQVALPATHLVRRPASVDPAVGAALPLAGVTALVAVREHAAVRPGERVLVVGATGGVGAFVTQLAALDGGHVTAVCRGDNAAFARDLGAAGVVDRLTQDATAGAPGSYDVVVDVAGRPSLRRVRRLLAPGGRMVSISGDGGRTLGPLPRMAAARVLFAGSARRWSQVDGLDGSAEDPRRVQDLLDLVVAGRLRVDIERSYDLSDAAAAVEHLRRGSTRGKVVVTV